MGTELRAFGCREGQEPALLAELASELPASRHRVLAPGLVESVLPPADAARPLLLAFATFSLPCARWIEAPSIAGLAAATLVPLLDAFRDHDGPWRLHAFPLPGAPVKRGRADLVEDALAEALKKRQRRLYRSASLEPEGPWAPGEALVQLCLVAPERGLLSIAPPPVRERFSAVLPRFPGGSVDVQRDPRPPSRAYAKLLEAELRLGTRIGPGETVVDLGASPGGWTFVALDRGARAIAVDRSPLREDLMESPRLTFVRGDAFAWEPERPVDWLLCDVIAFPERSLELLERWLSRRLCRRFVVTVKLKGAADPGQLARLKEVLRRHAPGAWVRQLDANKHELTALGEL